MKTLAELAASQQLRFQGDGDIELHSVGTLENATENQISFLANSSYAQYLESTQAGAVILNSEMATKYHGNALITEDPYLCFAYIAQLFEQLRAQINNQKPNIHPSVVTELTEPLDDSISIGPLSYIAANVKIGTGTIVESHVSIGKGVQLGKNCHIKTGARVAAGCQIGDRVMLHPGVVIGADGFGLARGQQGWVKIPQTGVVQIGDDCEIGANTTIDRGAIEDTVLGKDVRLDNQIQIGHNVIIGDHTVIAGCTAVAGSAEIGKNCLIGGGVGIVGHIKICDGVTVQAMALVTHSIKKPGSYSSVSPLQPTKQWQKNAVRAKQLDKIARKVNQLERKIND